MLDAGTVKKEYHLLFNPTMLEDANMVCFFRKYVSIWIAVIGLYTLTARTMRADSYEVFRLSPISSEGFLPYGLDDNGTVVLLNSKCQCYETFVFGQLVDTSLLPPAINFDNGSQCNVPGSINEDSGPACNNGRALFEAANMQILGGPPTDLTVLLNHGAIFRPQINALGDMVFVDNITDVVSEYVDITTRITPEPSSYLLFGTGVTIFCGAAIRKSCAREMKET
jgi:hypothetical protein